GQRHHDGDNCQDEEAVARRGLDDPFDHGRPPSPAGSMAVTAGLSPDSESRRKLALGATASPSARPPAHSVRPSAASPGGTSRGVSLPAPSATKTTLRVPVSITASSGTTSAARGCAAMLTSANISGLSSVRGFSTSMRTFTVRVFSSTTGYTKLTRPCQLL